MKKKIILYFGCVLVIFVVAMSTMFNFNKEKELEKIQVGEVAHSIFYAPFYVAYENKYFEEKGIDAEIILLNGADKVASALLSDDVEIGLSGAEATIYVYNGGEKNYLQTFSQLTQKDGSFIVSRKKIKNFSLEDLKGSTVIGGRAAGMPEMTLEYVLKQNNIDPRSDLNIDTSIAFPAMGGTFIGGYGDYVTLFEPTASMVEKEGYGYVVASVGELGGVVPYTSFSARKDYIKENTNIVKNFDEAIQMGIDYVYSHTDEEVAKVILPQFPDSSLEEVKASVKRYREIEAWPKTTTFTKKSFDHLQDIMIDYGELDKKVSYNKLFYSTK